MKKKIIAIVGMVGVGKSEVAKTFAEKNFPILRFGKITDEEVARRKLPLNEESERKVRVDLRKKLGMNAYAKLLEPEIKEALKASNSIVLDGLYSWEEYTYLSSKFKNLFLLAIYAKPEIRYKRMPTREYRPLSLKTAKERDWDQMLKLNKAAPIAMADFLIENNDSKQQLKQKVEEFINDYI